jgi:hypothetical protein
MEKFDGITVPEKRFRHIPFFEPNQRRLILSMGTTAGNSKGGV